jgi:hypothetical protein
MDQFRIAFFTTEGTEITEGETYNFQSTLTREFHLMISSMMSQFVDTPCSPCPPWFKNCDCYAKLQRPS